MSDAQEMLLQAKEAFLTFSPGELSEVRAFFAPGRVNLIGEHTDYNGGYVLPAALTLGTWLLVRPRHDGVLRFGSSAFSAQVSVRADAMVFKEENGFANYPLGVLWALADLGVRIAGGDFFLIGNLPHSSGLSSSASVEMAMAVAATALAGEARERVDLIKAAQRAENGFMGVNSGIMDQFAVGMGEAGRALLLQCATLRYDSVPLHLSNSQFIIMNTCYPRGLADSKYNERFAECQTALTQLQAVFPTLTCLADVSREAWGAASRVLNGDVIMRRARHVIFENARTLAAGQLLKAGDAQAFGSLMNASHESLRDDYEVTGPALDAIVESAWSTPGCLGARMTGAGFGGCAVALVERDLIPDFVARVGELYRERTGLQAEFYNGDSGDGARDVTEEAIELWQS
ncbi:MAG: galactokinase [Firmicutes bacterium]|nr:galactokinase [Bacillota bacterium]